MSALAIAAHRRPARCRVLLVGILLAFLAGTTLLNATAVHADTGLTPMATPNSSGQPTNMPCYYNGVIIGLPTATPSPSPTPIGTPNPNATPTPAPTYGPPY